MTKREKLIKQIMAEAAADGEPVTREEAEEMADMELKATADAVTTEKERKKVERKPREPKAEKVEIIQKIQNFILTNLDESATIINVQREIGFTINGNQYSIQLIQHRPKKEG